MIPILTDSITIGFASDSEKIDDLEFVKLSKVFSPDDLINRTYLTKPDEDGQKYRAKIVQKIIDRDNAVADEMRKDPNKTKFLVCVEGNRADEIITYHEALDHVTREIARDLDPDNDVWKFKDIIAHQKVTRESPDYKGSSYNLMILWMDHRHSNLFT